MSDGYVKILSGKVALGYMDCSMVDYARALKTCIETEQRKFNPDNALIATLCNAARCGWELIEKMKVNEPLWAADRIRELEKEAKELKSIIGTIRQRKIQI